MIEALRLPELAWEYVDPKKDKDPDLTTLGFLVFVQEN